jgi:hypothetical protein
MTQPFSRILLAVVCAGALSATMAACSAPPTPSPSGGASAGSTSSATASNPPAETTIPIECSALPSTQLAADLGGIATTKQLSTTHMSCEFANANATKLLILNLGPSSPSDLAVLKTGSGAGGRTTTDISGLGSAAFSVSSHGLVTGLAAMSSTNVMYSITSNLGLAENEALIKGWMAVYH